MTYRGVYKDGVIVLDGDVQLREGARVEVQPSRNSTSTVRSLPAKPKKGSGKPKGSRRASVQKTEDLSYLLKRRLNKKQRLAAAMAAFGTWADRPDFKGKSTVQIANELRKRASRRGPHD